MYTCDADVALAVERVEAEAWAEHHLASPAPFAQQFGVAVRRLHGGVLLMASRGDMLALNRALALGFESAVTAEGLSQLRDTYAGAGIDRFLVQWSPKARSARDADFTAAGFRAASRMAKLWRKAERGMRADTTLQIREIGPDDGALYGATVAVGHGVPPEIAAVQAALVGRPGWRHYLALDGQRPVAGAALYVRNGIAWCGFGSTIPEARGRGAHSTLLARRIHDAAAMRCDLVACETMEETTNQPNPSYRNMRRAGFQLAYLRQNWLHGAVHHRSDAPAAESARDPTA